MRQFASKSQFPLFKPNIFVICRTRRTIFVIYQNKSPNPSLPLASPLSANSQPFPLISLPLVLRPPAFDHPNSPSHSSRHPPFSLISPLTYSLRRTTKNHRHRRKPATTPCCCHHSKQRPPFSLHSFSPSNLSISCRWRTQTTTTNTHHLLITFLLPSPSLPLIYRSRSHLSISLLLSVRCTTTTNHYFNIKPPPPLFSSPSKSDQTPPYLTCSLNGGLISPQLLLLAFL